MTNIWPNIQTSPPETSSTMIQLAAAAGPRFQPWRMNHCTIGSMARLRKTQMMRSTTIQLILLQEFQMKMKTKTAAPAMTSARGSHSGGRRGSPLPGMRDPRSYWDILPAPACRSALRACASIRRSALDPSPPLAGKTTFFSSLLIRPLFRRNLTTSAAAADSAGAPEASGRPGGAQAARAMSMLGFYC